MKNKPVILDNEELDVLAEIDKGEWTDKPLSSEELDSYRNAAAHTKLLQEKRQTTEAHVKKIISEKEQRPFLL